jgi:Tfp pilus assembly protein PilO
MTAAMMGPAWPGGVWQSGAARARWLACGQVAGCVLAFGAVLAAGIYLADRADWSGLAYSQAALEEISARAVAAERVIRDAARQALPSAEPEFVEDHGRAPGWASLMLRLAELAAASGLQLQSLEPQDSQGEQADARRTVRVVAHGGYPALLRLVGGLAALPALVVPAAVRIEGGRPGDAAAPRIEMSLDVFGALPGGDAAFVGGEIVAAAEGDPFVGAGGREADRAAPARLAGVIRDARAGLALFDDGAGGIATVAAGEPVGAARVVRVEPDGVALATADGPRRIGVGEGGAQW